MTEDIENILLGEYFHCVDCIDYDSEKNPNANTTPEEWCARTARMIAAHIETNLKAYI